MHACTHARNISRQGCRKKTASGVEGWEQGLLHRRKSITNPPIYFHVSKCAGRGGPCSNKMSFASQHLDKIEACLLDVVKGAPSSEVQVPPILNGSSVMLAASTQGASPTSSVHSALTVSEPSVRPRQPCTSLYAFDVTRDVLKLLLCLFLFICRYCLGPSVVCLAHFSVFARRIWE